jgi:TonB-linked SusC/RagA family outer membrane protein
MKKAVSLVLLLLCFASLEGLAQKTVSGKVTDFITNEPVTYATVNVKGTTIATLTDEDGKYSLEVPENATTLEIRFLGMETTEIDVSSGSGGDVVMMQDIMALNEMVITALGVAKEQKAIGYAVSKVSGDDVSSSGESNVIQSIAAKAPGVQVISSGGTPGSSSKVLIRGNSTFTGNNQPLIVVDGVPIDNSTSSTKAGDNPFNAGLAGVNNSNRAIDLNPEDIESVTVLKGPAAAALYGVRAGNGVIIYTTKRGTNAGKTKGVQVTYSTSLDVSQVNKLPKLQSTYAQGNGGGVAGGTATFNEGDPGPDGLWFTGDDVSYGTSESWGPTVSSLGREATDNVGEFFQTAMSLTNNVSVVGGTSDNNFRISVGDLRQNGIVPNTDFKRNTIRLNSDNKLGNRVSVSTSLSYIKSGGTKAQNGSNLSGVMLGLTRAPASYDLAGDGENGYMLDNGEQRQYFTYYDNPYWTVNENPFTDNINRFLGNINLRYTPNDWMTISHRLGTDLYSDARKQIFAVGSWDPPQPTGQIEENVQQNRELYSDLLVTMTKSFSENFSGNLLLGNNVYQKKFKDLYSRGRSLGVPNFYNLSNAADRYTSEVSENLRTAALFFDAGIDYKEMIFVNVTGRNEWASTFGPAKNNFFYPSVSSSFIFTELMENDKVLSFGKVRASYAQVGINPLPYSAATYYTSPTFTDGFTDGLSFPFLGQNGFGISGTLGDQSLSPETVTGIEFGTDLRFFQGRLNLDVTYYNQVTTDLLLYRPLAASSGFEEIYTNAGEMVNKGWEVMVVGTPVSTDKLEWEVAVNYSRNKNEVIALDDGVDEIDAEAAFTSIHSYAIVGQPYGVLYGTQWEKTESGQLIIDPSTGLPIVSQQEGNIGNPYPDWLMGIRNTVKVKGVRFTALLDIRKGGDIWNGTYARLSRLGRTEESADREQTYTVEGVLAEVDVNGDLVYGEADEDGVSHPNSTSATNSVEVDAYDYFQNYEGDAGGAAKEQAVQDGSWVRLREVGVSYRIDLKEKKFAKYLDLSFTGRNLWLKTDYKGVDPETSLTGAGSNVGGFDYFNMPGTKSFIFGLKVGF